MEILTGEALSRSLRKAVDRATERLWIAAPYVGAWPDNVRRLMGTHWQTAVPDARLLTDIDARGFRESTLAQFFRRGEVRSLLGLHAKLYVADGWALIGSSNLTGTAYSRRYEAGIALKGSAAQDAAALFERWWELPATRKVREDQLPSPKAGGPNPDQPGDIPLPTLNALPPDVEDEPLPANEFGDYTQFKEAFDAFAAEYLRIQRLWPGSPLAFEVDSFLNYLYHQAGRPSHPYLTRKPRQLNASQRERELRRYARAFQRWIAEGGDDRWREDTAVQVRRLLLRNRTKGLSRDEMRSLLMSLNSMNSYQINAHRVLNPRNNSPKDIQRVLKHLVDDTVPVQRRMADAADQVAFLGKASVQELIGFYYNGSYPLRNKNTNCGLRFFGYDVRVN